jgi:hypothetical protein
MLDPTVEHASDGRQSPPPRRAERGPAWTPASLAYGLLSLGPRSEAPPGGTKAGARRAGPPAAWRRQGLVICAITGRETSGGPP